MSCEANNEFTVLHLKNGGKNGRESLPWNGNRSVLGGYVNFQESTGWTPRTAINAVVSPQQNGPAGEKFHPYKPIGSMYGIFANNLSYKSAKCR